MAVRVVLDVPAASRSVRLKQGLRVLLGALLVAVAFPTVPAATLLGFVEVFTAFGMGGETFPRPSVTELLLAAVAATAAYAGFLGGLGLIRGRRRLALYLRKFGFGDSTRAVTTALRTAVGREVRVVTLDDATVAPVGVDRIRRWVAALVVLVFCGLLARLVVWVVDGSFKRAVEGRPFAEIDLADIEGPFPPLPPQCSPARTPRPSARASSGCSSSWR